MDVDRIVNPEFSHRTPRELAEAPVTALRGVTDMDGSILREAFGVRTIRDLATQPFFVAAVAIVGQAELEEGAG